MSYEVCLAAVRPRMWSSEVHAGRGGTYNDLVWRVKHPKTERWKTLIQVMLISGDVVFSRYDVYVSGQEEDGPCVITIDDEAKVLVRLRGRGNFSSSCSPALDTMNLTVPVLENFLLNIGGLIVTPHGATRVRTGMLVLGYQCCW